MEVYSDFLDPYKIISCGFEFSKLNRPTYWYNRRIENHNYYVVANSRNIIVNTSFYFMMNKKKIMVEIFYEKTPLTKILMQKKDDMFGNEYELIATLPDAIEPDFPKLNKLRNKINMYFTFS